MRHLLKNSITTYSKSTKNRYGEYSYGVGVDRKARFKKVTSKIISDQGEETRIDATAIVSYGDNLAIDDRVTYSADNYKIVGIQEAVTAAGTIHHYKLLLQKWQ